MNRNEAIEDILSRLHSHGLTVGDLLAAQKQPADPNTVEEKKSDVVATIFSYLGGIFVFAGITAFIAMQWDAMNSAARVVVTLGPGVVAFILGVISLKESRWVKLTTPLFLMAAWLQPTGLFVMLYEWFRSGSDPRMAGLFVFGIMAIQQVATFVQFRRTVLVFTSMVFGYATLSILLDIARMNGDMASMIIGLSMLCIGRAIQTSPHVALAGISYFIGSAFLLGGAFDFLHFTPLSLLYIALPIALIYFSTQYKSRALLFTSTVAMLIFIGDFTARHFADAVGWPIALIVFGFFLFGISAAAWRIKRKYL